MDETLGVVNQYLARGFKPTTRENDHFELQKQRGILTGYLPIKYNITTI